MKIKIFLFISILAINFSFSSCIKKTVNQNDLTPFEISSIDQPPRVIKSFPPKYPYEAKKNNISNGKAVVRFIVTKEGKAVNISIVESDPPEVFNESFIEAIEKYKFSPGLKNGVPVDVVIELPIELTYMGSTNITIENYKLK